MRITIETFVTALEGAGGQSGAMVTTAEARGSHHSGTGSNFPPMTFYVAGQAPALHSPVTITVDIPE